MLVASLRSSTISTALLWPKEYHMALLSSCNTREPDTLHRAKSEQVYIFRTFSSCTETNTSCSFRSNSRSILFVENGARWAGTASAELARLVREVSWEERGDKPALKERKMVQQKEGRIKIGIF